MLLTALLLCVEALPAQAVSPWDATNQVSQDQYQTYQVTIQNMGLGLYGGPSYDQGFRNRYNSGGSATASLGFQEATLYLTDQFGAMGLDVSFQSDYTNVVAELMGTETPDRIFIVSGHYDHPGSDREAPFIQEGYPGLMIAENTAQEIWNQGSNAYYRPSKVSQ